MTFFLLILSPTANGQRLAATESYASRLCDLIVINYSKILANHLLNLFIALIGIFLKQTTFTVYAFSNPTYCQIQDVLRHFYPYTKASNFLSSSVHEPINVLKLIKKKPTLLFLSIIVFDAQVFLYLHLMKRKGLTM